MSLSGEPRPGIVHGKNRFSAGYSDARPAWMHEGSLEAALLEGHEDLEVVGES